VLAVSLRFAPVTAAACPPGCPFRVLRKPLNERRLHMELLTNDLRARLLANGELQRRLREESDGDSEADFLPVVKLFTPDAGCTWLLTELDPDDPDIAFGLCDLGMGYPELGCVSLAELASVRGRLGLGVERDLHFVAAKPLSAYAEQARLHSAIRA
jgi:Protein of unknown function (DUF2958)